MLNRVFNISKNKLNKEFLLKGFTYINENTTSGEKFYAREDFNDNLVFATIHYTVDKVIKFGMFQKNIFTYKENSVIDLLDTFMTNFLISRDYKTLENNLDKYVTNENVKKAYSDKLPNDFKSNPQIKDALNSGFKILYTTDSSKAGKSLIDTVNIVLVYEDDDNVVFKNIPFVKSPTFAKTKKGTKWIQLQDKVIVVPCNLLNK
jgi:hypothetical protein